MGEYILGIIATIYAFLLWAFLIFVWRKGYREWRENRVGKPRRFRARVLGKRQTTLASGEAEDFLLFEYAGRQEEFQVSPGVYDEVRVHQEGVLFLRDGQFESFEAESEAERVEDLYGRVVKRR